MVENARVHLARQIRGTEADCKNREGEREVADFHDTGALRRIPLAIDWLDPLKGRPAFFPCLRCLPLVSFLNKLHTSQPDCMSVFCPVMTL